jgi:DNA-binding XRE family transcriptional regulator
VRKNARVPKELGRRIKKYRQEKNLSQEKVGEMVGLTGTYIGFIEQGARVPSIKTADKIARVLGIKLSDLFD